MIMLGCVFHDSHELFFRNPFGAVPQGTSITIRLKVDTNFACGKVDLRLWKRESGEIIIEMKVESRCAGYDVYKAEIEASMDTGLMWYYFIIHCGDRIYYYGNNEESLGGEGRLYDHPSQSYQITVYKSGFKTPDWFKNSIMYQIFGDRFFNGNEDWRVVGKKYGSIVHKDWYEQPLCGHEANDFFGGNIKGIIKKLSYLKELGVGTIYLNPIFESPSNHRYDTGDYMKIDPMLGNENDLSNLCTEAGNSGISIILDGVFSHTGSDSLYFNKEGKYQSIGAYQSIYSSYYSWYSFNHYPEEYDCWWGIKTLPNVNEVEPSYQDFILYNDNSVIKKWMAFGIKGWRLDVADELPEEFIKRLREVVKMADPEAVIIGEVWEDASNKVSYGSMRDYLSGEELDSATNYPLREGILNFLLGRWDAEMLHRKAMSLYENYPRECFYSMMNIIGSHDTPRIKTILGESNGEEIAVKRLKLASLFQMTFPGVPCIYYGDEAGLKGSGDPYNRGTYPWGNEDKYLLEWYKKITGLRNSYGVLKTGYFTSLWFKKDVYGFVRSIRQNSDAFGNEREDGFALVLLNRGMNEEYIKGIDINNWGGGSKLYNPLEKEVIEAEGGRLDVRLGPLQGIILVF